MSEPGDGTPLPPAKLSKPKRLTLQERLAQAAKSKKKQSGVLDSPSLSACSTAENSPIVTQDNSFAETEVSALEAANTLVSGESGKPISNEPKSAEPEGNDSGNNTALDPAAAAVAQAFLDGVDVLYNADASVSSSTSMGDDLGAGNGANEPEPTQNDQQSVTESLSVVNGPETSAKGVAEESQTCSPNPAIDETLKEEIAALKKEIQKLSLSVALKSHELELLKRNTGSSAVEKKLKEKETVIAQLMDEGKELSSKEIKQNERIRGLVAQNKELEASLKNYSEKNNQSLLKISEIEDLIKVHKFTSIDQLLDAMTKSTQKIADLQNTIDRTKKLNWEGKYKELQKLYETGIDEQRTTRKEISELSVQFELLQNLSKLELLSKEAIISGLNREIIQFKDEASLEVSRLESKIEQLRLENESFLKSGHFESNSDSNESSKKIDYQDYAKLSQANQKLQEQFLSSLENWRLIELDLRQKIENLNATVDTLKKSKVKATAEIKRLHSQLSEQTEEITKLKTEIHRLTDLDTETTFKLKMKMNDYAELEEQLVSLRNVSEADQNNYEMKIQTLLETITALQSQSQQFPVSMSSDNISLQNSHRQSQEQFLMTRAEHPRPPLRLHSLNSLTFPLYPNLAINTPLVGWDDNGFTQSQFQFIPETPNSQMISSEIFPQDAADSTSSNTPVRSTSGATKNIQIISKMSSNIRRLEMEILTLQEENEELVKEKEQAQQEIMALFDAQKDVSDLKARTEELAQELEKKRKTEDTLMVLVGEKSEQVEELRADVADLKDLMRQQVQQMIEMQQK